MDGCSEVDGSAATDRISGIDPPLDSKVPAADGPKYPIDTFDPLLRDLVSWGLVERDEGGAGSWRLVDAAQRRMTELIAANKPRRADAVVYFDHLCWRCHRRELTHLIDGDYICNECREKVREEQMAVELPEVSERRQRPLRSRRRGRIEESGPMAS